MAKYQINILSDKEFFKVARDNPRYKDVDDSNLGFADPEHHKAYVRYTSWPSLNKYLINHEFEHMLECKGTHEDEQGIRHKKFFKEGIAQPLAQLGEKFTPEWSRKIPVIGPMLEAQRNVSRGETSNRNIFGAFGAPLLTGATLGAGAGSGAFSKIGSGLTNLVKNPIGAIKGGLQNIGRGLTNVEGRLGDVLQGTRPGGGGIGFGLDEGGRLGGGDGILSKFGIGGGKGLQAGLGVGLLGASAGLKSPQVPDISANYDPLRQQVEELRAGRSTNPLTQFSLDRLKERLGGQFQGADPLISQQVNDSYNNLIRQYTSQYKMARPNADIATDTQFRLGVEEIERRRAQDLADVQQEERRNFEQLQTQSIAQSLGLESGTLQTLADIFQKGEEEQLLQLGLDSERINQLRQILAQAGYISLAGATGLNQFNPFNPFGQGG